MIYIATRARENVTTQHGPTRSRGRPGHAPISIRTIPKDEAYPWQSPELMAVIGGHAALLGPAADTTHVAISPDAVVACSDRPACTSGTLTRSSCTSSTCSPSRATSVLRRFSLVRARRLATEPQDARSSNPSPHRNRCKTPQRDRKARLSNDRGRCVQRWQADRHRIGCREI